MILMYIFFLLLLQNSNYIFVNAITTIPTLVISFICRNEGVNFISNLDLWTNISSHFIFSIDDRNSDETENIIVRILSKHTHVKFQIIPYTFIGFGQARTHSIENAWKFYGQDTTHLLIADPDWKPVVSTFPALLSQLTAFQVDETIKVYRFVVYDRNGVTFRQMDWLLRHRPGLKMKYHLHEVCDIGYYNYSNVKEVSLIVHEVEQTGTWHNAVGHEDSFSIKRYFFDLSLLYKDYILYQDTDPHTHYYLSITHHAIIDKLYPIIRNSATASHSNDKVFLELFNNVLSEYHYLYSINHRNISKIHSLMDMYYYHVQETIKFANLRLTSRYEDEFVEERWNLQFLLGSTYINFLDDFHQSELWFKICQRTNYNRIECTNNLAKLYFNTGQLNNAIVEVNKALQCQVEVSAVTHYKEWYCSLPAMTLSLYNQLFEVQKTDYNESVHTGFLKYLLVMRNMANNPWCHSKSNSSDNVSTADKKTSKDEKHSEFMHLVFSTSLQIILQKRLLTDSSLIPYIDYNYNNENEVKYKICQDKELMLFIIKNKYYLHICHNEIQVFKNEQNKNLISESENVFLLEPANNVDPKYTICLDFITNLLPPTEDFQVLLQPLSQTSILNDFSRYLYIEKYLNDNYNKINNHLDMSFIGSANILDIIHNVYHGYAPMHLKLHHQPKHTWSVTPSKHVYRILFAEYFNERNIYFLLTFIHRYVSVKVEIIVVTPYQKIIANIQNKIHSCFSQFSLNNDDNIHIVYHNTNLLDYFKSLLSRANNSFSFIEYNGGLSLCSEQVYKAHLSYMSKYLSDDGVIGMTYFTCNVHQNNIFNYFKKRGVLSGDNDIFKYSKDDITYLNLYFQSYFSTSTEFDTKPEIKSNEIIGNNRFLYDENLIQFLLFQYQNKYSCFPTIMKNNKKSNLSTQFVSILKAYDFKVQSVLPKGYTNPYIFNELSLKTAEINGIDESSFIYFIFPSFRNTIYLTKTSFVHPSNHLKNDDEYSQLSDINKFNAKKIWIYYMNMAIIDRTGLLENTFSNQQMNLNIDFMTSNKQSTLITFKHYSNSQLNISFSIISEILPCLTLLSTWASVTKSNIVNSILPITTQLLFNYNYDYHKKRNLIFDKDKSKRELIKLIQFLENVNIISLLHLSSYYFENEYHNKFSTKEISNVNLTSTIADSKYSSTNTTDDNTQTEHIINIPETSSVSNKNLPHINNEVNDINKEKNNSNINIGDKNDSNNALVLTDEAKSKIKKWKAMGFKNEFIIKKLNMLPEKDVLQYIHGNGKDDNDNTNLQLSSTSEFSSIMNDNNDNNDNNIMNDNNPSSSSSSSNSSNHNNKEKINDDVDLYASVYDEPLRAHQMTATSTSSQDTIPDIKGSTNLNDKTVNSIKCSKNLIDDIETCYSESNIINKSETENAIPTTTKNIIDKIKHKLKQLNINSHTQDEKSLPEQNENLEQLLSAQLSFSNNNKKTISNANSKDSKYNQYKSKSKVKKQNYETETFEKKTINTTEFDEKNTKQDSLISSYLQISLPSDLQTYKDLQSISNYRTYFSNCINFGSANSNNDNDNKRRYLSKHSPSANRVIKKMIISPICEFLKYSAYDINNSTSKISSIDIDTISSIKLQALKLENNDNDYKTIILQKFAVENLFTISLLKLYFDIKQLNYLLTSKLTETYIQDTTQRNIILTKLHEYEHIKTTFKQWRLLYKKVDNDMKIDTWKTVKYVNYPDISFMLPFKSSYNIFNRLVFLPELSLHNKTTISSSGHGDMISNHDNNITNSNIMQTTLFSNEDLVHSGAMKSLQHASHIILLSSIGNDTSTKLNVSTEDTEQEFAVIDIVLKEPFLFNLTKQLVASTIHNDVTTGGYFASYHNDGLIHSEFQTLARVLNFHINKINNRHGFSLSIKKYFTLSTYTSYNIKEMFDVSMGFAGRRIASPVMQADEDEVYAILWLNSDNDNENDNVISNESKEHGLFIFDKDTSKQFINQSVGVNISVHPHFLSKQGDLDINMAEDICVDEAGKQIECGFEMISSASNRLVILGPQTPFQLSHYVSFHYSQSHIYKNDESDIGDEFTKHINIAFVMLLQIRKLL